INGHVNSVRYIEHILDLFPIEYYQEMRIRRFEIAYIMESYYNDELKFYKEEGENKGEFNVEVKKESGEVVCRSKILFV
ncbi:acyl-[acyl-carrier-protein] thioesterase, partial [Bacteroides sp. OttesenSCG-928-F21]|nr:acyl-[acyl-carrier-protein] thioesterase [Bacteroides sp. OttesenSCG-928-F21]